MLNQSIPVTIVQKPFYIFACGAYSPPQARKKNDFLSLYRQFLRDLKRRRRKFCRSGASVAAFSKGFQRPPRPKFWGFGDTTPENPSLVKSWNFVKGGVFGQDLDWSWKTDIFRKSDDFRKYPFFMIDKAVCILRMDWWYPPSEFTFRFYTPWTYLLTSGKFWEQGQTKKQQHLSIRNNGRLWKSRLWVFLEYIEIIGSEAFRIKRK